MNSKLFFIILLFCIILIVKAADEVAENTSQDTPNTDSDKNTPDTTTNNNTSNSNTSNNNNSNNNNSNSNNTNNNNNSNANSNNTPQNTDGKTNTNSNNNGNINSQNGSDNKDNLKQNQTNNQSSTDNEIEDAPLDEIKNTNTTLDSCGTTSSQLGMFSFYRPISKSVLVPFSNFTVIWYYNNIIYDSYNYPTNNITIGLYYEDDANYNSASSWKTPVFERTLTLDQIEEGPTLTGNVRSYKYNWKIMYDENGASNADFHQTLKPNEKYKLRISGDGKDLQRNPNNCYSEGDIIPGVTRAFYVVENNHMPLYGNIIVPDGALTYHTMKILIQIILPIALALYYLFIN